YRQAARAVRESPAAVEQMAAQGRLTELRGIGKTIAEKIETLLETGEIPAAVKLKKKFPPALVELTRLPGLGPKTARKIYEELGISSAKDLQRAAKEERLRSVPGLGPKVEENILAALAVPAAKKGSSRRLLSHVLPIAEEIAAALRAHPAANEVEIAGSVRRMTDTCKDIDIIATANEPRALSEALATLSLVQDAATVGEAGARVVTNNGIAVDLRVVSPEQFGNVLQHLTGSKQHNMQLREYAVKRGLHVSEYGVEDDRSGQKQTCSS